MVKLIVLLAVMAPVSALAAPLELVCDGRAVKTVEESSSVSLRNDDGDKASGSVSAYKQVRSDERFRIRIESDGTGSIKVPSSLVPTLRSGGKDGWWPLQDLQVGDDQIRGGYRLNILNKGRFLIDRRTGEIDLSALALKFNGTCEKAPEAPAERKF